MTPPRSRRGRAGPRTRRDRGARGGRERGRPPGARRLGAIPEVARVRRRDGPPSRAMHATTPSSRRSVYALDGGARRSRPPPGTARPATDRRPRAARDDGWTPSWPRRSRTTPPADGDGREIGTAGCVGDGAGLWLWEVDGQAGLARRLRRSDPERHPHRPRVHAARAPRPRVRDLARRRSSAPGCSRTAAASASSTPTSRTRRRTRSTAGSATGRSASRRTSRSSRGRDRRRLAVGVGIGAPRFGHRHERDLAGQHHPEALAGQLLQVGGVVEPLDLSPASSAFSVRAARPVVGAGRAGSADRSARATARPRASASKHDDAPRAARGVDADTTPAFVWPGRAPVRVVPRAAAGEVAAELIGLSRPPRARLEPAKRAFSPSSSSIRRSWLYLAVRSPRLGAPVLICPAFVATARSAIVVSSVSPLRWRYHVRVAAARGQRDRVERLGERADLVHLDQDRVRDAARGCHAPAAPRSSRRGRRRRAAPATPSARRERRPSPPSRPRPAVLERDDREAVEQVRTRRRSCRRRCGPRPRGGSAPSSVELARSPGPSRARPRRRASSPAFSIAASSSSSASAAVASSGANPPSSPTPVARPASCRIDLQRVEALGAPPQRLGERRRADRHHHELLELELVVGVRAAVDHVHHRRRQRRARSVRRGTARAAGRCESAAALATASETPEDRVRAEGRLVGGAVEVEQRAVDAALVERVEPGERLGDRTVHVRDGRRARPCRRTRRRRRGARAPRARRSRHRSAPPARPNAPSSSQTSTSTVGLPRESRISRAWTDSISDMGCRWYRTLSGVRGFPGSGRGERTCPGGHLVKSEDREASREPEPRVPVLRPVLGVGPQEHLLGPGGTAFGGGPEHERAARAPGRGTPRACRPTRPARGRRPRRARSTPRARRRRARGRSARRPHAPTCRGSRRAARSRARSPSTCTGAGSRAGAAAAPRTTPPRSRSIACSRSGISRWTRSTLLSWTKPCSIRPIARRSQSTGSANMTLRWVRPAPPRIRSVSAIQCSAGAAPASSTHR